MISTNDNYFIRLSIVFFTLLFLAHSSLGNEHSQKAGNAGVRALEMQLQQVIARENVKHKMLQDQIAAIENRLKILEEEVKENQKEIKSKKRHSR